jgi:ATP-binding cassette subfamily F protein 3
MELQRAEIKKIREFIERFRYKATKASQVQSRIKMLEKFDVLHEEGQGKSVKIRFPESPRSGKEVLAIRGLVKSYGNLNVFHDVNFTLYRGEKAAVVGVNGAGKSTLSRILSGEEAPTSGEVGYGLNVKMAFFSQESAQNLNYSRTLWEEVNAAGTRSSDQERRNLLGAFLFSGDDVYKEIAVLSGGEKSRLALLKILLTDTNLLILDEPTNHLDLKTREIFQNALLGYQGTILIVSHDRFFLDCLVNRVFELRDGVCHEYRGNYSYFIEKRREEQSAALAPPSALPSPPVEQSAAGPAEVPERKVKAEAGRKLEERSRKTKEEKRLDAEERSRISQATSAMKRDLAKTEEGIALLEAKKKEGEAALCEPDIYRDPERIKRLNQELKAISVELEDLYYAWNDLSLRLEAIEESLRSGAA